MREKIIFVFDNASWLDANRSSFYKTLNNYYRVITISTPSQNYEDTSTNDVDQMILQHFKTIESKNIDCVMGLSINGVGLTESVTEYFSKNDIPFHIWYWDHPEPIKNHKIYLDSFFYYHVSQDYLDFFKDNNISSSWLPFSTSPYVFKDVKPNKAIMFIGALWHINQHAAHLSAGLICDDSDKIYHTQELLGIIHSKKFSNNVWKTRSGKILVNTHILSALSSIKRAQYLSCIQYHGLDIYGDIDWQFNLWEVAPELYNSCINQTIHDENKLRSLMHEYKLTINLFHYQNQNGGPNMRILDCANFGLPIFSDMNEHCNQIFPHNEAAYYFKSKKECILLSDELIENDGLRKRLVANAADILNQNHTHVHRVGRFLNNSGLSLKHNNILDVQFINFNLKPQVTKKQNNLMKTQQGEIQAFWSIYIDSVELKYQRIVEFINLCTDLSGLKLVFKATLFRIIKVIFNRKK